MRIDPVATAPVLTLCSHEVILLSINFVALNHFIKI